MSTEENKALARQFYEEWNKGNLDGMLDLIAPNAVDHAPPPGVSLPPGLEGIKQTLVMFMQAFPDLKFTVEDAICEGDKVVLRMTSTGTNSGELMGMPATGKKATVTGIDIFRVADGKLVEHWRNDDTLGMMQQLGVIPMPDQAPAPA
jgi:steroid delta-isomerase-like uncharacterized protein